MLSTMIKDSYNKEFSEFVAKLRTSGVIRYDSEVSKVLNTGTTNLSLMLSGKRNVTYKMYSKLVQAYAIINNDNNENEVAKPNVTSISIGNGKSNMYMVPLKAQGGFVRDYEDVVFLDKLEKISFPFVSGTCYAFEVEDFSMFPEYAPHDFVVCTEIESLSYLRKGGIYVFQTIEGLLLKVFEKTEGDKCIVHSLNDEYNPVEPIKLKSLKKAYYKEYVIKK